ncbi:hypothetical protein V866_006871 [Kwoniella sp. B9012]
MSNYTNTPTTATQDLFRPNSSLSTLDRTLSLISRTFSDPIEALKWLLGQPASQSHTINQTDYDRLLEKMQELRLASETYKPWRGVSDSAFERGLKKEGRKVERDEWGVAKLDLKGDPITLRAQDDTKDEETDKGNAYILSSEGQVPERQQEPEQGGLSDIQLKSLISNARKIDHLITTAIGSVQSQITEERLKMIDQDEITNRVLDDSHKLYKVKNDLLSNPNPNDGELRKFVEEVLSDNIRQSFELDGKISLNHIIDGSSFASRSKIQEDGVHVLLSSSIQSNDPTSDSMNKMYEKVISLPKFHTSQVRQYFSDAERYFESETANRLTESVLSQAQSHLPCDIPSDEGTKWHKDTRKVVRNYITDVMVGERGKRELQGRIGQGTQRSISIDVAPINPATPKSQSGSNDEAGTLTLSLAWRSLGGYFEKLPSPIHLTIDPHPHSEDQESHIVQDNRSAEGRHETYKVMYGRAVRFMEIGERDSGSETEWDERGERDSEVFA